MTLPAARRATSLGALGDRAARRTLLGLLARPSSSSVGTLVVEEGATAWPVVGGEPVTTVCVHDPRAYGAVVRRGSVGLAESYVAGWWDSDDLTAVVRIALRRSAPLRSVLDRLARWVGPLVQVPERFGRPSPADDRRNVAAHYDLSNEFFGLMLDPTMAYSCAVFEHSEVSLEDAQVAKFDRMAAGAGLKPDDRVLEIGTGWGGFAIHAAERYGCRVTTTTISDAQRSFTEDLVRRRGLEGYVTVLGSDYRELSGRYDALVSIEMVEAVDWRLHDRFFATCASLLVPGGRMALQAITIDDASFERAKRRPDFVRSMVFPGGCLPSLEHLAHTIDRVTDLRIVEAHDIGSHYAETLRRWRATLHARRAEVAALGFDQPFLRFWDLYLCYCEAAFIEGHVSDVQLMMVRADHPRAA